MVFYMRRGRYWRNTSQSSLEQEKAPNVLAKLEEAIRRLDKTVGVRCVSKFAFVSCNGMRYVREKGQEKHLVKWSFGCAAHSFNNFTKEIAKLLFKNFIKKSVFIVKANKIQAWYKSYLKALLWNVHALIRYTILKQDKMVVYQIHIGETHVNQERNQLHGTCVTTWTQKVRERFDFELTNSLADVVVDPVMWREIEAADDVLNLICHCIGELASDTATIFTAYACFPTVRIHINGHQEISDERKRFWTLICCISEIAFASLFMHFLLDAIRSTLRCAVTLKKLRRRSCQFRIGFDYRILQAYQIISRRWRTRGKFVTRFCGHARQAVSFTSDVKRMVTVHGLRAGPIWVSIIVACTTQGQPGSNLNCGSGEGPQDE